MQFLIGRYFKIFFPPTHAHTLCTCTRAYLHGFTHARTQLHTRLLALTCIHAHTYSCTYLHALMHIFTCIHTRTYMHLHAYIHTLTCIHTCIRTCIHAHTYMHIYTHTHTLTFIHTHTCTHIHTCIHANTHLIHTHEQMRQTSAQLQVQVQLLEQEVGLVKSKNASERSEEEATLNAMHLEIKQLVTEK